VTTTTTEAPEPVLTEPAYAPTVLVTSGGDPGPITIWVPASGPVTEAVDFEAHGEPEPIFTAFWWALDGAFAGFTLGNPANLTINLDLADGVPNQTYTIRASGWSDGVGFDEIEVTLIRLSA
jgi:hypothetical protein